MPDGIRADVVTHYTDGKIVTLIMALATINVWNRVAVTNRQELPADSRE